MHQECAYGMLKAVLHYHNAKATNCCLSWENVPEDSWEKHQAIHNDCDSSGARVLEAVQFNIAISELDRQEKAAMATKGWIETMLDLKLSYHPAHMISEWRGGSGIKNLGKETERCQKMPVVYSKHGWEKRSVKIAFQWIPQKFFIYKDRAFFPSYGKALYWLGSLKNFSSPIIMCMQSGTMALLFLS